MGTSGNEHAHPPEADGTEPWLLTRGPRGFGTAFSLRGGDQQNHHGGNNFRETFTPSTCKATGELFSVTNNCRIPMVSETGKNIHCVTTADCLR